MKGCLAVSDVESLCEKAETAGNRASVCGVALQGWLAMAFRYGFVYGGQVPVFWQMVCD